MVLRFAELSPMGEAAAWSAYSWIRACCQPSVCIWWLKQWLFCIVLWNRCLATQLMLFQIIRRLQMILEARLISHSIQELFLICQ